MIKTQKIGKIKQNDKIFALKIKTESNGLGVLKTLIVLALIALQLAVLILSYLYFLTVFRWYFTFSIISNDDNVGSVTSFTVMAESRSDKA